MEPRIHYKSVAPGAYKAMAGLESYLSECGLEKPLRELVKLRASQINGCAFCLDMHSKDARARAKPNSASTPCLPGARPPSSPNANAQRSPGPKP